MAPARRRAVILILVLLGALLLPIRVVTGQDFGDPLQVDSDGTQPIDLEPIPGFAPIGSLVFDLDGDGVLETITFSASTPAGLPVVFPLGTRPGTFPTPTRTLTSQPSTGASLPVTIRSGTPLMGFSFDLIDPQFPTPEVMADLAGLDLETSTLGQVIEVLDQQGDSRGTVIRAFDDQGNAVPFVFHVEDLDRTRPIGPGISQVTDLSAEGGPVTALSIPGDGNASLDFSELVTLTVVRVSASASTPFTSITITAAVPGTTGVPSTGDFLMFDNLAFSPVPRLTMVDIDIKPGTFPNSINPRSRGRIPVAILSTPAFDATTVDPVTVRFGAVGTEASAVHAAPQDVDGDGDTDLVLHFRTQSTGVHCETTSASLTATTVGGRAIEGSDSIQTVSCP